MRLVIGVLTGELTELRQTAERTRAQLCESQQREKVLVRRLAAKEQETQDYVVSTRTTATTGSNVLVRRQSRSQPSKLCLLSVLTVEIPVTDGKE